jgi:glycosyltransferase involved in cell wall biosynthesis
VKVRPSRAGWDLASEVDRKLAFSVVVPCFNEEGAIRATIHSLRDALAGEVNYELILIDDGSTDGTSAVMQDVAAEDGNVTVVRHESNRGYGAALKTGIRHASSDWIVITDADGTYPNEKLPELLALAGKYDMVVGSRTGDQVTYPLLRRIPKIFLRAYACWISGTNIPDLNSGMRVFRRDLAEQFLGILPDGFSFTTTITLALLTNRHRVCYHPINYAPRIGRSKIQPIRDTLRFLQLIVRTGMYFAPLRVFSPFILLLGAGGITSAAYDIFVLDNLTDKTILLFLFAMNTAFFALVADMIDKRSGGG